MREALNQCGLLVESDQKELIIRVAGFQEADHGVPGGVNVVLHAPADVEEDSYADRSGFLCEMSDALLDLVFVHFEMLFFQPGHVAVEGIRDGDFYEDGLHSNAERRSFDLLFT